MKEYSNEYVERMREAFRLVQDRDNWKMPVDAVIPDTPGIRELVSDAVIFFAGCLPEIIPLPDGKIRVTAIGYYNAVGS